MNFNRLGALNSRQLDVLAVSDVDALDVEESLVSPWQTKSMSDSSSIDLTAIESLQALAGEGEESTLLNEVISTFLDSSPPLLETMKESARKSEAKPLREAAHSLKSGPMSIIRRFSSCSRSSKLSVRRSTRSTAIKIRTDWCMSAANRLESPS